MTLTNGPCKRVSICVIAACFHQVEATFPPNGSNLSRLWKQGFHPLDEQTVEKVKDEGSEGSFCNIIYNTFRVYARIYIYVIKTTFTTFILHPKYCL